MLYYRSAYDINKTKKKLRVDGDMPIPKKVEPLGRQSAKDRVFEQVREWIITGQLLPGEQLYDLQLAEYFQVSRTPVREAFLLLKSQGLVIALPGSATTVTKVSLEQVRECYVVLAELQGLAIELACEVSTAEQLQELTKKNESFKQAALTRNTMAIMMAEANFHEYLADISGNRYISEYCRTLLAHVARVEHLYFAEQSVAERSAQVHDRIIELIGKHDKSAGEYLKNDWLKTLKQCEEMLQKKQIIV
jgi:DNA-binding GntR family transcriptional regulator